MSVGPREVLAASLTLGRGQLARYGGSGTSVTSRFESELCQCTGAGYALAVNSGTNALVCALVGLGVGPGDEVLVPAYTFVATAAAPLAVGAVPVLVDIDESLTLDPIDMKRKITARTKAVIPVHMLNLVCDLDAITALADESSIAVVEDACQAVGVSYHGRKVGTIGHAGAFSFNQYKNITSGEGGALITNDQRVHTRAAMFHDTGNYMRSERSKSDEPLFVGLNLRMPEICSAILRPQLRRLDRQMQRRRERRQLMLALLRDKPALRISPHHAPDEAVGLTVMCSSAEVAETFGATRGVTRLFDTGRHVYTNWEPVWARRTHHPRIAPYEWAYGPADSEHEVACPNTVEILKRSCNINLDPDLPMLVYRKLARSIAEAADRLDEVVRVEPRDES
jgi:dTDP-4-amino-4,6-dideoxygalactose transaminase